MQILARTMLLTGGEREDILIGLRTPPGVVFVIENRGPTAVDIVDVGMVEPNRFVVIGSGREKIQLRPPINFTTVDVKVFAG